MYVKRHEQFEIGCGAILNTIYYYYLSMLLCKLQIPHVDMNILLSYGQKTANNHATISTQQPDLMKTRWRTTGSLLPSVHDTTVNL